MISFAYKLLTYCVIASLLLPTGVFAATDSFNIHATVTGVADATAPSIPTGLTATAVSVSAINLSWTASTDNVSVTGYQVFRDSIQIATSSGTTYSDTGLATSTAYTYFVKAFDAAGNISAASNSDNATTFSPPAVNPGGVSSGSVGIYIVSIEVIPGSTTAVVHWRTSVPTRSVFEWGKTTSYEIGRSVAEALSSDHRAYITDLLPGTEYKFRITGQNSAGVSRILTADSFVTLIGPDVSAPSNVRDLRAVAAGKNIVLTWINPNDPDFDHVRVLGNDRWYPGDTADGALIYEGNKERTIDIGAVVPGTTKYYTVFSYDENGNTSSGAIVALMIDEDGTVHIVDFDAGSFTEVPAGISLADIQFIQDNRIIVPIGGTISLDGSRALLVVLPYNSVPEHLKSILMTIKSNDGTDASVSFLLRVNENKTAYTAAVAAFGISGAFPFSVSLIVYKVKQIGRVEGILASRILPSDNASMWSLFNSMGYFPYFILFLVVLLVIARRLIRGPKLERVENT